MLLRFTAVLSETIGDHTMLYVGTNGGTVEKLVIAPDNNLILTTEFVVAVSNNIFSSFHAVTLSF